MTEPTGVAYFELWQHPHSGETQLVKVFHDGRRQFDDAPDVHSHTVLEVLQQAGYVFEHLEKSRLCRD